MIESKYKDMNLKYKKGNPLKLNRTDHKGKRQTNKILAVIKMMQTTILILIITII